MDQQFKLIKLTSSVSRTTSSPLSPICNLHPNLFLSHELVSLLNKGLSFIPSPTSEPNRDSICSFVEEFIRKVEWATCSHFNFHGAKPPFSLSEKSFVPRNCISEVISKLGLDIKSLLSSPQFLSLPSSSPNLSIEERKTIQLIKNDSTIIIHPADKGGQIVIQHRDDYIFEAFRQLHDSNSYKQIDTPIFTTTSKIIKRIVDNLYYQGFISKSQHRFLKPPTQPRQRHFYILPKIHKPQIKWTIPNRIPAGRPIVSGCNSETAAIEHFIDFYLQPIAALSPSFIRDTSHFKAFISNTTINNSDLLVTFDVESLYTSIPISEGIDFIRQSLTSHPLANRPDAYILKLLEITLRRNDFQFLDKTFLQIKGTAMGKKYAPSFANIYMHFWEVNALSLSHLKPSLWKRYIDDIFCIWPYSVSDLQTFILHLNSTNPNIKITSSFNTTEINFLDCTVFKSKNNICTKVFFKESNNLQLLHPKSYHPKHVFNGIVKAQILRYLRLSSFHADFQHSYLSLKYALQQIGYSRSTIRNCKAEAFKSTAISKLLMITGCQPCFRYRCHLCKHTNITKTIQGNTSGDLFLIVQNTNCCTRNCIYTINCTLCPNIPTLYVGETKQTCRDRMNHHISDIRLRKDTPISHHFNQANHNINHFKVTIIQFLTPNADNPTTTDYLRKSKECTWISRLKSYSPYGINSKTFLKSPFVPLTQPFSKCSTLLMTRIKSLIKNNPELKNTLIPLPSYINNKNLVKLLAPTKLI